MQKTIILLALLAHGNVNAQDFSEKYFNILNKIGYGVTNESLKNVKKEGVENWVLNQVINSEKYDDNFIKNKYKNDLSYTNDDISKDLKKIYTDLEKSKYDYSNQDYRDFFLKKRNTLLSRRIDYDLFSENRVKSMMTNFWLNHFYIYLPDGFALPMYQADYENNIRSKSMGSFKNLLSYVVHSPSMLLYLNNNINIFYKKENVLELNENYARELLELHTMGVNSGYSQEDIIELGKLLTGHSIIFSDKFYNDSNNYNDFYNHTKNNYQDPKINGFYAFYPEYHLEGNKHILGKTYSGDKQLENFINDIAMNEKTVSYIVNKIATYFLSAPPSNNLLEDMKKAYIKNNSEIKPVLLVLFKSKDWKNSLNTLNYKKDLYHYSVSTINNIYSLDKNKRYDFSSINDYLFSNSSSPYSKKSPNGFSVLAEKESTINNTLNNINYALLLSNKNLFNQQYDYKKISYFFVDIRNNNDIFNLIMSKNNLNK